MQKGFIFVPTNKRINNNLKQKTMKATEILNKRLSINSTWYGYANHEIVDFEIAENGKIIINYDDFFNGEAHIYNLTFSIAEIKKMLNGEKVIVRCSGDVETTTEYSLI